MLSMKLRRPAPYITGKAWLAPAPEPECTLSSDHLVFMSLSRVKVKLVLAHELPDAHSAACDVLGIVVSGDRGHGSKAKEVLLGVKILVMSTSPAESVHMDYVRAELWLLGSLAGALPCPVLLGLMDSDTGSWELAALCLAKPTLGVQHPLLVVPQCPVSNKSNETRQIAADLDPQQLCSPSLVSCWPLLLFNPKLSSNSCPSSTLPTLPMHGAHNHCRLCSTAVKQLLNGLEHVLDLQSTSQAAFE
ncbi:hypothetical protein DFH08DRAFT_801781 [Mycena albidolilacea]|uniref:Uncharacterized protein n=1 Tax=Mycena albidolilacea TaxID=1033008 RepID=A0AAD7AH79_9AGAR|nr:hypothetical protein DFH08DRAFT_801781 [Mycena albidolilacea]